MLLSKQNTSNGHYKHLLQNIYAQLTLGDALCFLYTYHCVVFSNKYLYLACQGEEIQWLPVDDFALLLKIEHILILSILFQ